MNTDLSPHIIKLIKANISGLDIIHGELKNIMLGVQTEIDKLDESDPLYAEGDAITLRAMLFAYQNIYKLTYDLSFGGAK